MWLIEYWIVTKYQDFIIVVDGCIIIIHEVFTCDSTQWNSLRLLLLKRQEPFLRHWLQNEIVLHTFKLLWLLWKANLHEIYSHTTGTWKCWTLPPFRDSYVREFELSHSNRVNRIIKITHAHDLHVKMLVFKKTQIVYYKIFSSDFKKSPRPYYNICN